MKRTNKRKRTERTASKSMEARTTESRRQSVPNACEAKCAATEPWKDCEALRFGRFVCRRWREISSGGCAWVCVLFAATWLAVFVDPVVHCSLSNGIGKIQRCMYLEIDLDCLVQQVGEKKNKNEQARERTVHWIASNIVLHSRSTLKMQSALFVPVLIWIWQFHLERLKYVLGLSR